VIATVEKSKFVYLPIAAGGSRFDVFDSSERPQKVVLGSLIGFAHSLDTLESDQYRLRKPVLVVVNGYADRPATRYDNWVARFPEAGISASGDSAEEAIANLRDIIILKFKAFSSFPASQLGVEPTRQLAVLRKSIIEQ